MICLLALSVSCSKEDDPTEPDSPAYKEFTSYADFKNTLNQIVSIADSTVRTQTLNSFYDSLRINGQVPFTFGDSVALMYYGKATSVKWAGDFNGWNPDAPGYTGTRMQGTNLWMAERTFPSDARLDYKIVRGGSWFVDFANPYVQYSGFGPNSELRMPDWIFPQETVLAPGVTRGTLGEDQLITSIPENLGYPVNYRVYTPYGYESMDNLPVIYVTDGHEYADDKLGAMLIVLDNLIFQQKISPLIAVFIDPREPGNPSNNRRMEEYTGNIRFANFVADELVPAVDNTYKTNSSSEQRAILGTSLGGWNAAFFGLRRSDVFGLIGIHSPAFDQSVIEGYAAFGMLPLKIFMSTGVIYDTQEPARAMKEVLESKGYPLLYKEVNQGHSWGNWKALLDDPLIYFFGQE